MLIRIFISLFVLSLTFTQNLLAKKINLTGAGATFPYPFYSKVFEIYYRYAQVKVNYQGIGSGGGIRQLRARLVDFGATDVYVNDKDIVHIPTVAGAVVITYNLPGNPKICLTGEIISNIFLGKITRWDDPKIKALNPHINLPKMNIVVVHRSDGSGTTFIFSDYLCKVSPEWKSKIGCGKALNWPVGVGAKGNPGVAGLIKQIPGSIGYTELTYALSNNMPYAKIRNSHGNFIDPSIKSVTAATNVTLPNDLRILLTNTDAPEGYPISGFTWLIVYKDLSQENMDKEKAQALVKLLWWIIHQGQSYAKELYYAPLSKEAQKKAEVIVRSITYKGEKLWK